MTENDLGRLRGAYGEAWDTRQQTGDASRAVLIEKLTASGLEVFSSPGSGRDLMVSLWERGVPPEALERELRRALPRVASAAIGSSARSAVELVRILRDGGSEGIDFSWQDLPERHRKLSDSRKTNDLVLRWLHAPVDKVALDLRIEEAAAAVIERCRQIPSANRDGWAEAYCWLLPDESPRVQVMIGEERVGWATVPDQTWSVLKGEEQRRIYADGSIFLDYDRPQIELVCYIPRDR